MIELTSDWANAPRGFPSTCFASWLPLRLGYVLEAYTTVTTEPLEVGHQWLGARRQWQQFV